MLFCFVYVLFSWPKFWRLDSYGADSVASSFLLIICSRFLFSLLLFSCFLCTCFIIDLPQGAHRCPPALFILRLGTSSWTKHGCQKGIESFAGSIWSGSAEGAAAYAQRPAASAVPTRGTPQRRRCCTGSACERRQRCRPRKSAPAEQHRRACTHLLGAVEGAARPWQSSSGRSTTS